MKKKLWTKNYATLLAGALLVLVAFSMIMSVLPYRVVEAGGSKSDVGLLMAVLAFSALVSRPVFGNLIQQGYLKSMMVSGAVVMVLVTAAHFAEAGFGVLLVLRILSGLGLGALTTGAGTLVSFTIPVERRGEGLGYFGMTMTGSGAIGPVLGLTFYRGFGFGSVVAAALVFSVLGTVVSVLVERFAMEPRGKGRIELFEKSALSPAVVLFFIAFVGGSLVSFIPLYAMERQLSMVGLFFPFQVAGVLLARVVTGRVFDTRGIGPVMVPAVLSAVAGCLMLAFGSSNLVMLAAALLFGYGYGAIQPAINALMVSICPPGKEGLANAAYYTTMDFSVAMGSIGGGLLTQHLGFTNTFLVYALMCAMSYTAFRLLRVSDTSTIRGRMVEVSDSSL